MPDTIQASIYSISAMAGCMWGESTLNPNIWESGVPQTWDTVWYPAFPGANYGYGGYGLGQWTNTRESGGAVAWRLLDFKHWCDDNHLDITQGNTQLQYILYENVWFNVSHVGSNAQTLREFLESPSNDIAGLTEDFLANWEGVPGNRLAERIQNAYKVYRYITEHLNDVDTVSWQGTDSTWMITEAQTLNNALCFYAYFNGAIPPGPGPGPGPDPPGPTPTRRRKSKIWMWLKPNYKR